MKANQYIAKFVETCIEIKTPGLIMSVPGVGKTTTIELYCKYKDYNLTTLIASQYGPDDLLGIQSVVGGKLDRLAPYWYDELVETSANGKYNVLFIDEITTCDPFVQAPLLNLIFNKSLGKHKLPQNTFIMAAGNYSENLNNSFGMTAPLLNRFLILNLDYDTIDYNSIMNEELGSVINSSNKDDVKAFLGLTDDPDYTIDLDKIKSDIFNNIRKSSDIEDTIENGVLGFTSPRSLNYCINFMSSYAKHFNIDTLFTKVVGDTLGRTTSNKFFREHLKDRMPKYNKGSMEVILKELINDLYDEAKAPRALERIRQNSAGMTESTYKLLTDAYRNGKVELEEFKRISQNILKTLQ